MFNTLYMLLFVT